MNKTILVAVLLFVLVWTVFAQTVDDPKYKLSPTIDKESTTGVYIPKDLEDCFRELKSMFHPSFIGEIKQGTEKNMIKYHFVLGMWIRNNWGLWGGSRLKDYFNGLGIFHPDDMSGIILDSFWRHLNNRPIKLQKQIKFYQKIWKNAENEYKKRGLDFMNKGQYDLAIWEFNIAVEINPNNEVYYINRGRAYYFKGEYDKSWEDFKKAQDLGYKVPAEFLEDLRKASGRQK